MQYATPAIHRLTEQLRLAGGKMALFPETIARLVCSLGLQAATWDLFASATIRREADALALMRLEFLIASEQACGAVEVHEGYVMILQFANSHQSARRHR